MSQNLDIVNREINLEGVKMENIQKIEDVLIPFLGKIEKKYQEEKKIQSMHSLVELNTKYCKEKIMAYKKAHPIMDGLRKLSGILLFFVCLIHVIAMVVMLYAGETYEKLIMQNTIRGTDVLYMAGVGIVVTVMYLILNMWMEHKDHEMVDENGKKILQIDLLVENLEFDSLEDKYRWILKNYQSKKYNKPIIISTRHFKENLEIVEEIIDEAQDRVDD